MSSGRVATRAAALTGRRDPATLDSLAAAYAANGRFDEAVATAEEAMTLADIANLPALWVDIRERLGGYRRERPFVLP